MNSREHKAEAERLLEKVGAMVNDGTLTRVSGEAAAVAVTIIVDIAQVHATLANVPDPRPAGIGPY